MYFRKLVFNQPVFIMQGNKRKLRILWHILHEGHVSHKLKKKKKILKLPRKKTYCTYKLLCAFYSVHRSHKSQMYHKNTYIAELLNFRELMLRTASFSSLVE